MGISASLVIVIVQLSSQSTRKRDISLIEITDFHTELSYPSRLNGLFKYYGRPNRRRKHNEWPFLFARQIKNFAK